MSDDTRVSGRLVFEPPLTWSQYRVNLTAMSTNSVLRIDETTEGTDTDEGQLTVRHAVAVVPRKPDQSWTARGIGDELAALAKLAAARGARLTGHLFIDSGDGGLGIERWWINYPESDNPGGWKVMSESAVCVWPDGSAAYIPTRDREGVGAWWLVLGNGGTIFAHAAIDSISAQAEAARRLAERSA